MTLEDFYLRCNNDVEGYKRYNDLVTALLVLYDDDNDPLEDPEVKAIRDGDPFLLQKMATGGGPRQKRLRAFLDKVSADSLIMPTKFKTFREKMIAAHDDHANPLTQKQKDIIAKGSVKEVKDELLAGSSGSGGSVMAAFQVGWTSCNPPS